MSPESSLEYHIYQAYSQTESASMPGCLLRSMGDGQEGQQFVEFLGIQI